MNSPRRPRAAAVAVIALPIALALTVAAPASAAPPVEETTLVSKATGGTQGNSDSTVPAISADGRYITYTSYASNLVTGDTNGRSDVFLTDTTTGATTLVSTASGGTQGNSDSYEPAISANGRYITYYSDASTLVTGDTNGRSDVFLTDTTTGATTRISTASGGTQGNSDSYQPAISADGRYITYYSNASNLVTGDTNSASDVFLTDTTTGATTLVSKASGGTQGNSDSYEPAISADGRYITYTSYASTLVTGDTNSAYDVFLTDTTTGATTRISTASGGTQGNSTSSEPAISADGRYITYQSSASNLVTDDTNNTYDVFLTDTTTGTTRISTATGGTQGNSASTDPAISADGGYITYQSSASNLVTDDTNNTYDVFLTDTTTGTTRISTATGGTQGNSDSYYPAISADGRYITYTSDSSNLVTGDTNITSDVFRTRLTVAAAVTPAPAALAATGTDPVGLLAAAAALFVAGILAMRARRTRHAVN